MEKILIAVKILWFALTFYYTIIRSITTLKIFDVRINNLFTSFGLNENKLSVLINLIMWLYQIVFWFTYFNINII